MDMDMEMIVNLIDVLEKKGVGVQLSVEDQKTVEITVKDKKVDINIVKPANIGKLLKELDLPMGK
ncbi:formate-dependent nitrite reductase cytochrome c552 subunit [Methanococcus voltae]|nr:formate-dependent nitrite reductase cytochrome c552 subunit [Methanococcus voltae]